MYTTSKQNSYTTPVYPDCLVIDLEMILHLILLTAVAVLRELLTVLNVLDLNECV